MYIISYLDSHNLSTQSLLYPNLSHSISKSPFKNLNWSHYASILNTQQFSTALELRPKSQPEATRPFRTWSSPPSPASQHTTLPSLIMLLPHWPACACPARQKRSCLCHLHTFSRPSASAPVWLFTGSKVNTVTGARGRQVPPTYYFHQQVLYKHAWQ